jgi:glycosyltransferase involved in cell wall biosynthesis
MAVGLPALASPQRSYVEAIEHRGGGVVAAGTDEWRDALELFGDDSVRSELGRRAWETVRARYATSVVAAQYRDVLRELA